MELTASEKTILTAIGANDGISRKELAKATGLSPGSVTLLTKALLQGGYIVEGERIGAGLGRKEVLLHANPDKFYFLGIDIGGYRVRMAVSDNRFAILHEAEFLSADVDEDAPKEAWVVASAVRLMEDIGMDTSAIAAIGIGVTGIVDAGRSLVLSIPNAKHWERLDLPQAFRQSFRCPVYVEEGGRTMLLAEKFMGKAKDEADYIVVHSAYSVVAGMMIGGQTLRGARNAGGLLGHITADPNGTRCTCGNYGCLENIVTYPMLEHEYKNRDGQYPSLIEAYRLNDKTAIDVCIEAGQAFGIALSNVVNLFNPVSIYLGGPMFDDFPILFEEMKRTITLRANRFATLGLQLERSSHNHRQGLYGALILAKHELLFPS